jgi:hypothetical protein
MTRPDPVMEALALAFETYCGLLLQACVDIADSDLETCEARVKLLDRLMRATAELSAMAARRAALPRGEDAANASDDIDVLLEQLTARLSADEDESAAAPIGC